MINNAQSKINTVTFAWHQKKHDGLIVNKRITDGIKKNPSNVITNLTRFELTEDEGEVLNFGLKSNVLSRPSESEMVGTMEYVWEKIKYSYTRKWILIPNIVKHLILIDYYLILQIKGITNMLLYQTSGCTVHGKI